MIININKLNRFGKCRKCVKTPDENVYKDMLGQYNTGVGA